MVKPATPQAGSSTGQVHVQSVTCLVDVMYELRCLLPLTRFNCVGKVPRWLRTAAFPHCRTFNSTAGPKHQTSTFCSKTFAVIVHHQHQTLIPARRLISSLFRLPAAMRFINSDTNTFSKQTEDSSISKGETAEPGEVAEPDQGATKPAPEGATISSVEPERKPLPRGPTKIKLNFKPGSKSAGSNPFKSTKTPKSEDGVSKTSKTSSLLSLPPCAMFFQGSHELLDGWTVLRDAQPELTAISPRHSSDQPNMADPLHCSISSRHREHGDRTSSPCCGTWS